MKRAPWKVGMALLLALSMTAAACGGRDDDTSADGGGTELSDDNGSSEEGAFIDPDEDCDDYDGTQGIEGNTIKIGTIRPESGNYAIYDQVTAGLEAFFNAANEDGGLEAGDGERYEIELVKKNDEYDPARTPALARQLVEQDGVFAMVGNIGTETNLAIRDYVNDNCVPNIGLATGSTQWGEANSYPWYISALPSYAAEANAWVEFLSEENPEAQIALLYQDDDFGEAYRDAIEASIEGTDMSVVAEQSFNPRSGGTTEAAVTQMSTSGADVFIIGIGGSPCPVTLSFMPDNWGPMTFISVTCASRTALSLAAGKDQGVYIAQPTLDPADPEDSEHPRIVEFKERAAVGGLDDNQIEGGISAPGWGFAAFFAEGLRNAETVDRATVMNALYSLEDATFGLLRDEVTVNTDGADDPWAIEGFRIAQREGEGWVEQTPVTNFEGQTNDFAGG